MEVKPNTFEMLILIEIKKIVEKFNYQVVYDHSVEVYELILNFRSVGMFKIEGSYGMKELYFSIEIDENIEQNSTISYGQQDNINYLVPFFNALEKDLVHRYELDRNILVNDLRSKINENSLDEEVKDE